MRTQTLRAIADSAKSCAAISDSSNSYDSGAIRSFAKAIAAKPVNTTRRYAISKGRFVKTEEQSMVIVTAGIVMTGVATVITTTITIVTRFKFAFECAKGRQRSGGPSFCAASAENSPSLSRASRHVRRILRAKSVQVIRYEGCWCCPPASSANAQLRSRQRREAMDVNDRIALIRQWAYSH